MIFSFDGLELWPMAARQDPQLKAYGSQLFFEVPARTYRSVWAGKDKS